MRNVEHLHRDESCKLEARIQARWSIDK